MPGKVLRPTPRPATGLPYKKKFDGAQRKTQSTPPKVPCSSCQELCEATQQSIEAYHRLLSHVRELLLLDTAGHRMKDDGWLRLCRVLDIKDFGEPK
ncbi:hypothetical protein AGDE_00628 [Angomonas deanei]|uniref:Uncharacterized protein n=1 Tax=Angomonas deanei TaxID=59799 RepID=A0A7G2CQ51_9TRYP|nr:hypothetical protein AGDE_00628 [Angomonas deanei]CAD2221094.1 hypothetical protein, conserved [Angomonas deanei]|eukprot:EPY43294.1 hypothetical protein AGDE_00628 [Angomonas deanei]